MANAKQRHELRLKKLYSRWASRYNVLHTLQTGMVDQSWRRIIASDFSTCVDSVLDMGTGTGLTAAVLLNEQKARCVVGVDLNVDMLKQTTQNTIRTGTFLAVNGNAMTLPFKDNTFNAVVSMLGLGGIFNIEQAYREMVRVVRDGGAIYSIEMCTPKSVLLRMVHRILIEPWIHFIWGFRDIKIEPILRRLNVTDYEIERRRDLMFGTVYHLKVTIHK